jgi:hypothetical protein
MTGIAATAQRWIRVHIERGTPYADEDTVLMDPGWYIVGRDADGEPTASVRVEYAADADGNDTTSAVAEAVAEALNNCAAQVVGEPETEVCPSCSLDGGYGNAVPARTYRCPTCQAWWSPDPDGGEPVTSWIGNWWQRMKVWATSARAHQGR